MAASKTSAHLQISPQKSWITRRMVDLFYQHNWSISCTLSCETVGLLRTHGNGFGCGISRIDKRPRPFFYQQVPSKTKALHHALRPALWWSVSTLCVAGVFPSPPWLSNRSSSEEEATALAATHANMVPHCILQALFGASSMASPSSHVPC